MTKTASHLSSDMTACKSGLENSEGHIGIAHSSKLSCSGIAPEAQQNRGRGGGRDINSFAPREGEIAGFAKNNRTHDGKNTYNVYIYTRNRISLHGDDAKREIYNKRSRVIVDACLPHRGSP